MASLLKLVTSPQPPADHFPIADQCPLPVSHLILELSLVKVDSVCPPVVSMPFPHICSELALIYVSIGVLKFTVSFSEPILPLSLISASICVDILAPS